MYGAWCFGDISRTADTLVLYKTVWGKHVCTVNVWDWLTGPLERQKKIFREKRWMDRWCGAGTNVAVDWMGFWWGKPSICVSPGGSVRKGRDGSSCSSVCHPDRGGISKAFEALGLTGERRWTSPPSGQRPRDQNSPLVTVWQELFLVFLVQLLNVQCVM